MTLFEKWNEKLGAQKQKNVPSIRSTILHRLAEDRIALKYHATNVVTAHRDGSITLDSGGWRTATTKARMTDAIRTGGGAFGGVYSNKGEWILYRCDGVNVPYADGITIAADGRRAIAPDYILSHE